MRYFIKTYGCQMNYSDSERIAGVLELAGYEKVSEESEADLVVLNVCSVRKSAVDKIAGNFKKYKKYKAINTNFRTVITGCVLESDREIFEKLFDLVIDVKEIEKLPERLDIKAKNCHSEFISESIADFKKSDTMQTDQDISAIRTKRSVNQRKILKQVQNDKLYDQDNNNINGYFQISPKHQSKITAYVPIMTGCNNFCSYCVVPYTRGREKSRPAEEIIDEIANLIENGYKEIILLGQNVNSYKSQIPNYKYQINSKSQNSKQMSFLRRQESIATLNTSKHINFNNKSNPANWILACAGMTEIVTFPVLLKLINAIPGDFWIRFLTSHPKDMTKELIKTVAECEKCAEHIHLALQSGDDEILEKMNRKYTAKHYLNLIKKIREIYSKKDCPLVAISTDIIVGFPGETKKQFQNTVKIMKETKFDMAYLNKYSPRAGTVSAKLKDDVSWKEKKNREDILNKVLRKTALENNRKYVGEIIDVLVEKIDNDFAYGKTRSFKNVKITASSIVPSGLWSRNAECNKSENMNAKRFHNPEAGAMESANIKQGQFSKIKITKAGAWGLEGKMV